MKTATPLVLPLFMLLIFITIAPLTHMEAQAQSVPLRPPIAKPGTTAPASSTPTPASALSTNKKFSLDHIQLNGNRVALASLPDSQMITSKTGRSISVARLKQLQAVLQNPQQAKGGVATITATRGQSLRTLTTLPANSRIALVDKTGKNTGVIASPGQLALIQQKMAKLSVRKTPILTPVSQPLGVATAVVGQDLSLVDALKRPSNQLLQVGNQKFSAEQLRLVDAQLKATGRYPGGLNDPKLPANNKGARK